MSAVTFDNVSIIFGDDPEAALPLMDKGLDRAEIQSATGQVLGVHDCTLTVEPGEILVLMGLTARRSVDLPDPDNPMSTSISPGSTVNVQS